MESLPTDYFTTSSAYTPHVYRDQYPAIDPTSEALSQAGKVVIITGASAGIGARGFVPAFAKAGPKAIILVARNKSKLDGVIAELKPKYSNIDFLAVSATVTDANEVNNLYDTIKAKYGYADVLISNAGSWASGGALIKEADPAQWWEDFEVNVKGAFLVTQGFLKLLGPEKQGTIITLNTGVATMIGPTMSSYSVSKTAALRLVEYIAAENPNVTAISLQPGVVATDMVVDAFKRFALDTPELVGGIGVWLSTDAARFLNGRFVSANWSVEDLMKQKDKIVNSEDLKMANQGRFGLDKFSEEEKR